MQRSHQLDRTLRIALAGDFGGHSRLPADRLNENVDAVASLRARAEKGVSRHQRRIERVTALLGRPPSVYAILAFVAMWIGANLVTASLGARPWDPPPFFWLQGLVGLGALLMTIAILTTQNRQNRDAGERGQLDLQINQVAEQKVAKLIALVEELRRDLPTVRDRVDEMAEVMKEPVDPHAVLSALEETHGTTSPETEPPSPPPDAKDK
jgi:uncharacterized membrane protein